MDSLQANSPLNKRWFTVLLLAYYSISIFSQAERPRGHSLCTSELPAAHSRSCPQQTCVTLPWDCVEKNLFSSLTVSSWRFLPPHTNVFILTFFSEEQLSCISQYFDNISYFSFFIQVSITKQYFVINATRSFLFLH